MGFYYGHIKLEQADAVLQARVGNISVYENYFILKLFINYEEIAFHVLGNEYYAHEFVFLLAGGEQIEIPFVLDIDFPDENYTYKLTAGIFVAPFSHAKDQGHAVIHHGSALNFDLTLGKGSEIGESMSYNANALAQRENVMFGDFRINTQFDDLHEMEFAAPTKVLLQARSGEEVKLSYFVNPSVLYDGWEFENYLILAMLGFEQIDLNGQSYLFVRVEEHEYNQVVEHGVFTITMPKEVGFYEFVAIMIPNPLQRNSWETFGLLEMADRFTIEVVD